MELLAKMLSSAFRLAAELYESLSDCNVFRMLGNKDPVVCNRSRRSRARCLYFFVNGGVVMVPLARNVLAPLGLGWGRGLRFGWRE